MTNRMAVRGTILVLLIFSVFLALGSTAPAPAGAQTAGPTPTASPPQPGQLSITKSVSPTQAPRGSRLTYTILVSNVGGTVIRNATLTDNIPGGLQPVSASSTKGTVAIDGQRVTAVIGDIEPGEIIRITIEVIIQGNAVGSLHNTAQVRYFVRTGGGPGGTGAPGGPGGTGSGQGEDISGVEALATAEAAVDALVLESELPHSGAASTVGLLGGLGLAACVLGTLLLRRRPAARA